MMLQTQILICNGLTPKFQKLLMGHGGENLACLVQIDLHTTMNYFELVFNDNIMNKYVTSTNAYSRKWMTKLTRNVTKSKLNAFFSNALYLGLVHPNCKLAQGIPIWIPFLKKIMSYDRFSQILIGIHYISFTEYSTYKLRQAKKDNPFFSVHQLLLFKLDSANIYSFLDRCSR